MDSFQAQSVEKLQIPDFFAPQMTHDTTEYSGIDVAVSRTRLVASAIGVVPQADRFLGSRFEVLPRYSPIILPLKRVGLQHDRFTKIQLRQGDTVCFSYHVFAQFNRCRLVNKFCCRCSWWYSHA